MTDELYRPLSNADKLIRLVRILPGRFDEPIKCTMFEASLETHPPFEALSYVWGDPIFEYEIRVNQTSKSIGKNLAAALTYLRRERSDRIMWIDFLCINQNDMIEQNHQVVLMGSIYSSALEVVVWLGEGSLINSSLAANDEQHDMLDLDLDLEPALDFDLNLDLDLDLDLGLGAMVTATDLDEATTGFSDDFVASSLSHLTGLFESPWWYRIWTFQEAVLAQCLTFRRGSQSLSETAIRHLQSRAWVESLTQGTYENWRTLQLARRHHSYGWAHEFFETSFLGMLATQRHRACEKPKDRLYGLLALAPAADAELVVPDYSLADTVVFADFAFAYIKSRQNLDSFSVASLLQTGSMPSWTVHWSASHGTLIPESSTMNSRMAALKKYNASPDPVGGGFRRLSESCISLSGVLVDYVEIVHELQWFDCAPLSIQPVLTEMVNLVGDALRYNFDRQLCQTAEVLYRLLLSCMPENMSLQKTSTVGALPSSREVGFASELAAKCLEHLIELVGLMDLDPNKRQLRAHVYDAMFQRSLIVTRDGYVGLAHNQTRQDDILVVLDGGRVPFILRQQGAVIIDGGETDCWKLIGDSCFYGLMNGEAGHLGKSKETFILM